jgi:hypothetical protein
MSESMAFIGGVAVAGLAALVLLKGTGTPLQQPNFAVAPQIPTQVVAPQVMPPAQYPVYGQQYPNTAPPAASLEYDKLKLQMDTLQRENQQLRDQAQQFQSQFETYKNQTQINAARDTQAAALQAASPSANPWWSSPIVWAVGGMTLTIGGGVVVAGVLSLFSPRQRPTRTVQVIHPYSGPTPPLAPVRRAEFLPPHVEARRVHQTAEYDEMR